MHAPKSPLSAPHSWSSGHRQSSQSVAGLMFSRMTAMNSACLISVSYVYLISKIQNDSDITNTFTRSSNVSLVHSFSFRLLVYSSCIAATPPCNWFVTVIQNMFHICIYIINDDFFHSSRIYITYVVMTAMLAYSLSYIGRWVSIIL